MVLVADAPHRTVMGAHGVVVARHAQAEVALVLAQFVGRRGVVAQPCQLEAESRRAVGEVDQFEAAVVGALASALLQTERRVVEGERRSRSVTSMLKWSNRLLIIIMMRI